MATPSENRIKRRLIFLAFSLFGLMAMAFGMVVVNLCYEVATIMAGHHGIAYWQEVLKGMFCTPLVFLTLFGLILVLGGAFTAIRFAAIAIGWVAATPTRGTWSVVLILMGLLALLAIGVIVVALS